MKNLTLSLFAVLLSLDSLGQITLSGNVQEVINDDGGPERIVRKK